jgi:probable rRNA maturation factor
VHVDGNDETSAGVEELARWCDVARRTLIGEGVRDGRLDLLFVDPADMAALNQRYLGTPGPTDVLAFPLDGPGAADEPCAMTAGERQPDRFDREPPRHLGDVVVCPSVARDQAAQHTGGVESELTLLIVHGVLHVLGHDHAEPDETRVMQGRERHHLERFGFRHPVGA